MITNAIPPSSLFARSMAVNSPLILGAGMIVGTMFAGAWWFHKDTDHRANKRAFLRSIAAAKTGISIEQMLLFQGSDDPIKEGLRMLVNDTVGQETRDAIRAALAVSL